MALPSQAAAAATRTETSVKYKLLYSFSGHRKNGTHPTAALIAVKGTLYGPTFHGGGPQDLGTIFAMTTSGKETTLHRFSGYDGALPDGNLLYMNGRFYGTTEQGGSSGSCSGSYCGTVFSMTPSGKEAVLHSFAAPDGAEPEAGLVNVKGTLYGTTLYGGTKNGGTVFAITTSGKEKVLYSFPGGPDGARPTSDLINLNGTLYGTTQLGGTNGCGGSGCGVVFSITTSGKETVQHAFAGGSDGADPTAGLTGLNGILYGTTLSGGGGCFSTSCGTVFSIIPSGKEAVLHAFGGAGDGFSPYAGLTNVKGTLYGTTVNGGGAGGCSGYGCGTIFSITPSGKETVLYSFERYGGMEPLGALLNLNGTLYGATAYGGANGLGTVFSLTP